MIRNTWKNEGAHAWIYYVSLRIGRSIVCERHKTFAALKRPSWRSSNSFVFTLATENDNLPPKFVPMVEKQNAGCYTLRDRWKHVVDNRKLFVWFSVTYHSTYVLSLVWYQREIQRSHGDRRPKFSSIFEFLHFYCMCKLINLQGILHP